MNTTKALRDSQGLLDGVADGQLANLGQLIDSQLAMRSRIIERLSAAQTNRESYSLRVLIKMLNGGAE